MCTNEFFQLIKIWQVDLYLFSVDIYIIFKLMLVNYQVFKHISTFYLFNIRYLNRQSFFFFQTLYTFRTWVILTLYRFIPFYSSKWFLFLYHFFCGIFFYHHSPIYSLLSVSLLADSLCFACLQFGPWNLHSSIVL